LETSLSSRSLALVLTT